MWSGFLPAQYNIVHLGLSGHVFKAPKMNEVTYLSSGNGLHLCSPASASICIYFKIKTDFLWTQCTNTCQPHRSKEGRAGWLSSVGFAVPWLESLYHGHAIGAFRVWQPLPPFIWNVITFQNSSKWPKSFSPYHCSNQSRMWPPQFTWTDRCFDKAAELHKL